MNEETDPNAEALTLKRTIEQVFPAEAYAGAITPVDGQLEPELDEELALFRALSGKSWTQVPPSVIDENPGGHILLTEQAFVAFLPAWLVRSLDDVEGDNETRDRLIYSLGPSRPESGNDHMRLRLKALSIDQRAALRSAIELFSTAEKNDFTRAQAGLALRFIDSVFANRIQEW